MDQTPGVAVVGLDGGERVDLGPASLRILEDGSSTAHRLGIAEITLAPHSDGPPQHRHAQHDEGFYVVSGAVHFTVGSVVHEAPPRTLVMVPPGAPHTFANYGDEPAVMLNTFTPDLYVQYFRDLRTMIEAGAPLTPENTIEVMRRYATEPAIDHVTSKTCEKEAPMTTTSTTNVRTIELPGGLPLSIQEFGENTDGTAVLMLHAGSGPRTIAGLSAAISEHAYVITPTHPGFDGTPRPDRFDSIADLATAYLDLIDALGLTTVMVIGNSVGGWIASEMALRDNRQRIGAIVLINAVGIHAHREENRIVDVRTINPADIGKLSFANEAFRPDFSTFTDEQRAATAVNQQTLAIYGGEHFVYDPALRSRLHRVTVPVLVVWGEQDGIAPLGYGRGYAAAFPDAHLAPIPEAGHFPQIEQPAATFTAITDFVRNVVKPVVGGTL